MKTNNIAPLLSSFKLERKTVQPERLYPLEYKLQEEGRTRFLPLSERYGVETVAIVTWEFAGEEGSIHETLYGSLEKTDKALLDEGLIKKIIRENLPRIIEAREEFAGTDGEFLEGIISMVFSHQGEILGKGPMLQGFCRSRWAGEGPVGLYFSVIAPETRVSVPFKIGTKTLGKGEKWFFPKIDVDHPDADLLSRWEFYGSPSHGRSVEVVWSYQTGKGFDLSRSKWPKGVPVNHSTLRRVVDERGKDRNCCGNYPEVYSIGALF